MAYPQPTLPSIQWICLLLSALSFLVRAQGPVQTFFPAAVPLAIRSPYMSVWDNAAVGSGPISNSWPLFWEQQAIMGWAGIIRVDGKTYSWMGENVGETDDRVNVTNVQITPTRSILVFQAGPMNVTLTYLSPIEPSDWVKQSFPFSYVSIEAHSTDGSAHSVQVYSDITPEWVTGDRRNTIVQQWSKQATSRSIYLEAEPQVPLSFSEINNQALDGKAYYAASLVNGLTWVISPVNNSRTVFQQSGKLGNVVPFDSAPMGKPWCVFAISVDLGNIQATSEPVTWAVGRVRNPSINYITPAGAQQQRAPYFTTKYKNIGDAIDAFTSDFSSAHDRAVALDEKIMQAAAKISPHYVDLVSLAARQTMGSFDITVLSDPSGNIDPTDVLIFMKDIGTSGRVNPVERMYAALPALLYLNASLVGPMLKPLLVAQDGLSGQPYAAQDLGSAYPNATGTHGAHDQRIEESGNMLIMMLAHARTSGDGSLLTQYYNLTRRWADYLVNNSLTPTGQQSADLDGTANQTNLAVKGIIGVKAMAEISRVVGQASDGQQYENYASSLIRSWQSLAMASNNQHVLGTYDDQSSWSLLYNAFADKLLQTNLVSQSVLDEETVFYGSQLSTAPSFGLPINSSGTESSAAWTLFTSAIVSDADVRNRMIEDVWSRMNSNSTVGAFFDHYDAMTGKIISGTAGPSLGAMFSHLALTVTNVTIDITGSGPPSNKTNSKGGSNTGAIVGGVIGGVAAVLIAAGIFFLCKRSRRRSYWGEKVDIVGADGYRQPYLYTDPASATPDYIQLGAEPHPESRLGGTGGVLGTVAHGYGSGDANTSNLIGATYGSNSSLPHTSAAQAQVVPMSSKARERAQIMQLQWSVPLSGSPTLAQDSQTDLASSGERRDPHGPGSAIEVTDSGSVSQTDVVGLRAEMENLRRVVQEIRADRLEPPPEYVG